MTQGKSFVPKDTPIEDAGKAIDMVQDSLDKFIATADVSRVYGEPIQHDDTLVIPAAETVALLGFGAGYGVGGPGGDDAGGAGGGSGGGGKTLARPVAVVVASPQGVRVEAIIDPTKIALAALTAFGFIFGTVAKMRKGK
jgi:uncharacterized spore protein YtfJ